MSRHRCARALGGVLMALALATGFGGAHAQGPSAMPVAALELVTAQGATHHFNVEVAKVAEHRHRGLMFRRQLADDAGMLFIFDKPQHISMWMKNTFISLTMVFIAEDGHIVRIVDRAVPLSEESILSGAPVSAVLELMGGSATRLDLQVGDRVLYQALASAGS